jgi:hypothetical protein
MASHLVAAGMPNSEIIQIGQLAIGPPKLPPWHQLLGFHAETWWACRTLNF